MQSPYCPTSEQETQLANEKSAAYGRWREAQIQAALDWVRQEDEPGDQRSRLSKLVQWFSQDFADEVERLHWGKG